MGRERGQQARLVGLRPKAYRRQAVGETRSLPTATVDIAMALRAASLLLSVATLATFR